MLCFLQQLRAECSPKGWFSGSPSQDASSGRESNPVHEISCFIDCGAVANDPRALRKKARYSPASPSALMRIRFQFTSGAQLCSDTNFPLGLSLSTPLPLRAHPSTPCSIWKGACLLGCTRQFPPRLGRIAARFDLRVSPHKCRLGPPPTRTLICTGAGRRAGGYPQKPVSFFRVSLCPSSFRPRSQSESFWSPIPASCCPFRRLIPGCLRESPTLPLAVLQHRSVTLPLVLLEPAPLTVS